MSATKGRRGERQSIYLPADVVAELREEARRQQRSLSSVIRMAWRIAKTRIEKLEVPK